MKVPRVYVLWLYRLIEMRAQITFTGNQSADSLFFLSVHLHWWGRFCNVLSKRLCDSCLIQATDLHQILRQARQVCSRGPRNISSCFWWNIYSCFSSEHRFLDGTNISRLFECRFEIKSAQGYQPPTKHQEMKTKIMNLSLRSIAE